MARAIPDLTAKMCDFIQLDAAALGQIRKTSEDPPRVSIYDVIRVITGLSASNSKNVWDRVVVAFPEVSTIVETFKFTGPGQRDTPVTDARGAVQIIMILPGRAAAAFRKKAAGILVRFLGGDETLVDEIAANYEAQSTLPEDDPLRFFGQTVESERIKRAREDLEFSRAKRARIQNMAESVQIVFDAMSAIGMPPDDRDRMRAKDMMTTALHEKEIQDDDPEICIRSVLSAHGVRNAGADSKVGKLAKRLYVADHPQYEFPKKQIYVNGQLAMANIWRQSQKPYIERAIAQLRASESL